MWKCEGTCEISQDYLESFLEELEEVTENNRGGKYFDPYDCFHEALDQWVERTFMYESDQDEFMVGEGLENCLYLLKECDFIDSVKDINGAMGFLYCVCYVAFDRCLRWEDEDGLGESVRPRRTKNRKTVTESHRRLIRRANHR